MEAYWNNRGESSVTMPGYLDFILALLLAVCLEANCLTSLDVSMITISFKIGITVAASYDCYEDKMS